MEDSAVKFLGFRVPHIEIDVKEGFYSQSNVEYHQEVEVQQNFSKDNNRFIEIRLLIRITDKAEVFRLFLEVHGGFEASKSVSDEIFSQFCKYNAPAILYPYARALITTYTAQANMPPVIVPLVSFVPSKEPVNQPVTEPSKV